MRVTICASLKFYKDMLKAKRELEKLGHKVYMPKDASALGVDYWSNDNSSRVNAKKKYRFIEEHLDKIEKSDAILVVNVDGKNIKNYIGANTFLEIGFAYYRKKKIFALNPLPDQDYIRDELETVGPIVLNGNYGKIDA